MNFRLCSKIGDARTFYIQKMHTIQGVSQNAQPVFFFLRSRFTRDRLGSLNDISIKKISAYGRRLKPITNFRILNWIISSRIMKLVASEQKAIRVLFASLPHLKKFQQVVKKHQRRDLRDFWNLQDVLLITCNFEKNTTLKPSTFFFLVNLNFYNFCIPLKKIFQRHRMNWAFLRSLILGIS